MIEKVAVTGRVPYGDQSDFGKLIFNRTFPSLRSRHIRSRFSPAACAMKIFSPQTMGDPLPLSGNGARQRTFSVAVHFTGAPFSDEMPLPSLRHAGQFAGRYPPPAHQLQILLDQVRSRFRLGP